MATDKTAQEPEPAATQDPTKLAPAKPAKSAPAKPAPAWRAKPGMHVVLRGRLYEPGAELPGLNEAELASLRGAIDRI